MTDFLKNICISAWFFRRITEEQIDVLVNKGKLTEEEREEILNSPQETL